MGDHMFPDVNAERNIRHGVRMRIPHVDIETRPERYRRVSSLVDALEDVYVDTYRDYVDLGFKSNFTVDYGKAGWCTVSYVVPVGANVEQTARFERVLTITRALIAVYRVHYVDLYAFNRWVDCQEYTEYL